MFTRILTKMGYTKEETSWILYDIGNSAQVLTTCTVIFPLLIAQITPGDSSVYVGWANTVYGLLLAVMSPILGTVADYKGRKMQMFRFFLYIGIIGGFALALPFIDYRMALIIFVIAMVGYNGTIIFYDAFIVDVCDDDERVDKVSAAGYAWGYVGSTLPFLIFVIPFALVTLLGDVQIGPFALTYRWGCGLTMAMAVLWWLIYSRPMLKNVRQKKYHEPVDHVVRESFGRLWRTFKDVRRNRNIFLFCLSYFFYIDCVNTVIKDGGLAGAQDGHQRCAEPGRGHLHQFVRVPQRHILWLAGQAFRLQADDLCRHHRLYRRDHLRRPDPIQCEFHLGRRHPRRTVPGRHPGNVAFLFRPADPG